MNQTSKPLIIVTGGTRGIGKAISLHLAQKDYQVIATYNKSKCETFHENVLLKPLDISNPEDINSFFNWIESEYANIPLAGLVNNAGVRQDALSLMMSVDSWNQVLDTNLRGTFLVSQKALLLMMPFKSGSIVNIGSMGGKMCLPGQSNYSASKAAIGAITKTMAKEVAKKNIRINSVSPGFINTEFIQDLDEQLVSDYKKLVPMKRFGTPNEVANVVAFLLGNDSSYITGADIEIGGGL